MDKELQLQNTNILIIDDDILILDIAKRIFEKKGAKVITSNDPLEALRTFYTHKPALVILDVMMAGMDGWEVCRQIRLLSDVPIIMLTSLSNDEDVIRALDNGADDFVTKPFNPKVLISRARAVLRRKAAFASAENEKTVEYADDYLTIIIPERKVMVMGEKVKLTPIEYKILAYLVGNSGRVLTFEQILENVWGWEYREQH